MSIASSFSARCLVTHHDAEKTLGKKLLGKNDVDAVPPQGLDWLTREEAQAAQTTATQTPELVYGLVKKKPCAESLRTGAKKTGHVSRKTAAAMASEAQSEATDDGLDRPTTDTFTLKIPAHVVWDKYSERMECLLDYLDAHSDVAIKLFGDSTQAAKLEGCSKLTAKSNKAAAYLQVVDGIFFINDDAAVRADFTTNPNKYAEAVDNYITNM